MILLLIIIYVFGIVFTDVMTGYLTDWGPEVTSPMFQCGFVRETIPQCKLEKGTLTEEQDGEFESDSNLHLFGGLQPSMHTLFWTASALGRGLFCC